MLRRLRRWLRISSPSDVPDSPAPLAIAPPSGLRVCHCLCGRTHPSRPGVCDAMNAITSRTLVSPIGRREIALCWPCAVAIGQEARRA